MVEHIPVRNTIYGEEYNSEPSSIMYKETPGSVEGLGFIFIPAIESVEFNHSVEVSKKPTENFKSMTDNMVLNPTSINVGCIIRREDLGSFLDILNKRYVVMFSFNKNGYRNLDDYLIQSFDVTEDVRKTTTIKVSIKLTQIKTFKFMDSKFLDKDGSEIKSPNDKNLSRADVSPEVIKTNTALNSF